MNKKIFSILLLCTAICFTGCTDPKNQKINTMSQMSDVQREALKKSLSPKDNELLVSYMMRKAFEQAFKPDKKDLDFGETTISQALTEQQNWIDNSEKRKAEAQKEKLENERKEKELKKQQEDTKNSLLNKMNESVGISVIKKEEVESKYSQRYVRLSTPIEDKTEQEIVGVKFQIIVKDVFGDLIKILRVSYDEPLMPKDKKTESFNFSINQFINDDIKLYSSGLEKLKIAIEIDTIIFKNGDTIKMPE